MMLLGSAKFPIMHRIALCAKFYDKLYFSSTMRLHNSIAPTPRDLPAQAIPERLSGHAWPRTRIDKGSGTALIER
jgi:hypothetical protein